MKTLGICGSVREDSNTNKLVEKVAVSSGCEFELVYLRNREVESCTGCLSCMWTDGQCSIKDGMQELYDKIMKAESIIIGSPTYYMNVSGAVKCFLDRTIALNYRNSTSGAHSYMGRRPLAGRPCVAVTTTAGGGHKRALKSLILFFQISKMNIVGELAEVVGINDIDAMPDVLRRAEKQEKSWERL